MEDFRNVLEISPGAIPERTPGSIPKEYSRRNSWRIFEGTSKRIYKHNPGEIIERLFKKKKYIEGISGGVRERTPRTIFEGILREFHELL